MQKFFYVGVLLLVVFLSGCEYGEKEQVVPADVLLQEVQKNNIDDTACAKACDNYVDRCLTLVPNADHVVFEEGRKSCLAECSVWPKEKTECIIERDDCPTMTTKCEL
ncbi:MAG: hypothetical protein WCT18_00220 [Patescibacteria group bacterium]